MIARADLVADLVAAITALSAVSSAHAVVDDWPGEEAAFNADAELPAVWVRYVGADYSRDEEIGWTTFERSARVQVIAQAEGAGAVLALLGALEVGLWGLQLGRSRLELVSENQERAEGGVYTYSQLYQLSETHSQQEV